MALAGTQERSGDLLQAGECVCTKINTCTSLLQFSEGRLLALFGLRIHSLLLLFGIDGMLC